MALAYPKDDKAIREDLLDIISNLSPKETQLLSGLGVTSAKDEIHLYLKDTLNAVKLNAFAVGVDATYNAVTNPARLSNFTQIFRQGYQVSDTHRAINEAGFDDRFTYEARKAIDLIRNDIEFALMRGSLVCSTGTVAGNLRGVKNSLSLVTSQSGVSLTEKILNDYFQLVWDNTNVMVNSLYLPMYHKRKIAAFVGNATQKNVSVEDRRLINSVSVYEADSAEVVKLFAHRYVRISTDTNYDIVGINEDFFKIAYLRRPFTREIAKTGDASKGEVVAELTLEARHHDAGFWGQKHL